MFRRILMLGAVGVLVSGPVLADDVDARVAASRGAVKQLFAGLKTELVKALEAGGPAKAIHVCNEQAMPITEKVTQAKGWRVARTSLKLRNPGNAPDAWEKAVMEKFEARKAAGENPAKIEHWEVVEKDGGKVFRYMKAVPTAEKPCLACHGAKIDPAVTKALAESYPDDKATGYKAGDIRGAFTIEQPIK